MIAVQRVDSLTGVRQRQDSFDTIQEPSEVATQEFAHPQARFLHEKQRTLSPRARHWLAGLLAAVNRASFKAIDGAMFVGTVRSCCFLPSSTF